MTGRPQPVSVQLRLYLNHLLTREDKVAIRMFSKRVEASTFEGLIIDGIGDGFEAWGTSKEVAAPDNLATPLREFRAPETELEHFLKQRMAQELVDLRSKA